MTLVVSAGMQKSGSAWIYNIINELLRESGGDHAESIKKQYDLENVMRWKNNNVGKLSPRKIARLIRISRGGHSFVVKTHAGPSFALRVSNSLGYTKVVYSYRDPRDVIASAMDHGEQIIAEGNDHTFAKMIKFEDALLNVKSWIRVWRAYDVMSGVLTIRYEDMYQEAELWTQEIERFLGLSIADENRRKILWRLSKDNPKSERAGLHFNQAVLQRYRERLTQAQIGVCNTELGTDIVNMGFSID